MNKLGLIKYVLIFISTFLFTYFLWYSSSLGDLLLTCLLLFLIPLTLFMFYNKNKIKKFKRIYDIILMLLMAYVIVAISFYLYSVISCIFNINCLLDFEDNNIYLFLILSYLMLLFNFKDIYTKTNKTNDIITIIVCLLIILVHARYYLDTNFIHRISKDETYVYDSFIYITQNYIYFNILYTVTLLHKLVNNKTMNQS